MVGRTGFLAGILLILSLIILGCGEKKESTLEERNKELVIRDNQEIWNKGNLEMLEEFYSVDFVHHFLPTGAETKGLEELRNHIRNHRQAFPDWAEEIKQIIAEGDLVVTHFSSTGTNIGSFMGNPPTGKKIHVNEMSIYRIVDGKIVEQWLLPDLLSVNQQLGLISQSIPNPDEGKL